MLELLGLAFIQESNCVHILNIQRLDSSQLQGIDARIPMMHDYMEPLAMDNPWEISTY